MDQSLKALKTKWYRKLKKSGFNDIEDTSSPNEWLKDWHSRRFQQKYTQEQFKEKLMYYQQVTYFCSTHTFSSKLEERVWCLYSEGFSYREIAKQVRSNKDKVNSIIIELLKIMRNK